MTNVQPYTDNNALAQQQPEGGGVMTQQANQRVMSEVQSRMVIAKRFPRDELEAIQRIKESCKRPKLAEAARYSYPKGGTRVTGPSIRLAEAIAQRWGNIEAGFKELDQRVGEDGIKESVVEAYAWDLETNTRIPKHFTVKHVRDTRNGTKKLTSQRDIYEMVANQGARRLRSCILAVIPGDVVDEALEVCEDTIKGNNELPLKDRIKKMLDSFEKFSVTKGMIEDRLGHKVEAMDETEFVAMIDIFNSLNDGMSGRDDWFDVKADKKKSDSGEGKKSAADAIKGKDEEKDEGPEEEIEYASPSSSTIRKYKKLAGEYLGKKEQAKFAKLLGRDKMPKERWESWKEHLRNLKQEAEEAGDE